MNFENTLIFTSTVKPVTLPDINKKEETTKNVAFKNTKTSILIISSLY